MRLSSIIVMLFVATVVQAQQPVERILLPVITAEDVPISGAFESSWQTKVSVTNTSDRLVRILGYNAYRFGGCGVSLCVIFDTPPNMTFYPEWRTFPDLPNGTARWLLVDPAFSDQIFVTLRIQDRSRQSLTWGTSIPVVRERDYSTRQITLLDIPTEDRFRWTLRVYDPDARADAEVLLRYYATNPKLLSGIDPILDPSDPQLPAPDVLVHEERVRLTPYFPGELGQFGYAQIASTSVPSIVAIAARLRIDVVPVSPGLRVWAFASITNNETQHVTVVAPQ